MPNNKPLKLKPMLIIFLGMFLLCGYFLYHFSSRENHSKLEPGSLAVPEGRAILWQGKSELTEQVVTHWAAQELPDWQKSGKVKAPRIIAAKLAARNDIEDVNVYLLKQEPWGNSGSSWFLHPDGDYDFTLTILTGILWLFGDNSEVLYTETRDHLLDTLLTEEGQSKRLHPPKTLGLVNETENHILMTQGSCYLKNRWLADHGKTSPKYDNMKNGMESLIVEYLGKIESGGLYEFNSIPYLAYTITALLNLEAFGSEQVQSSARRVLDRINWQYAVGSLSFRRCVPFRRHMRNASITSLKRNYQHIFINVWMSLKPGMAINIEDEIIKSPHSLWGVLMPYRLPDKTAEWIVSKPANYFIRIGHGANSSPEIYSGGPGYLLSAGGVNRGWQSMIAARPTTLMLDDGAKQLDQVLHLAGPGENFMEWNNTGVFNKFACAAGKVHIPAGWEAAAKNKLWQIYSRNSVLIALHSSHNAGIVVLFEPGDAEELLQNISEANPDESALRGQFHWPNGDTITYDLHAPQNRWVITSFRSKKLDREFDKWPLMDGRIE